MGSCKGHKNHTITNITQKYDTPKTAQEINFIFVSYCQKQRRGNSRNDPGWPMNKSISLIINKLDSMEPGYACLMGFDNDKNIYTRKHFHM